MKRKALAQSLLSKRLILALAIFGMGSSGLGCGGATVGTGLRMDGATGRHLAQGVTLLTIEGKIIGELPKKIIAETDAGTGAAVPKVDGSFLVIVKRSQGASVKLHLQFASKPEVIVEISNITAEATKATIVVEQRGNTYSPT